MSNEKKVTGKAIVGDAIVKFVSEVDFHELLDTNVYIGDTFITCIAGCDIRNFTLEFQELIKKYRI